jgi:TonB family protein
MAAFGTERLGTILPVDGVWRAWSTPAQPGDFAYDNKMPWFRAHPAFSIKEGPLTITGKRLDGPAPSFIETFQVGGFARERDNVGYMGGISISAFGCWEITGHYAADQLRFVEWVVPPPLEQPSQDTSVPKKIDQVLARPLPTHRIQVDADAEAKELVYRVIPEIPHEAKVANISGTVVLHVIVGATGRVTEARYVSGPTLLSQAAIEAVRWSQYRVTDQNTDVETQIRVDFPTTDD